MLSGIIRHFLTLDVEPAGEPLAIRKQPLAIRERKLQEHLNGFPRNVEDRDKLISRGYSGKLWSQVSCEASLSDQEST